MLYLLSPAKTLDFDTPVPPAVAERATRPAFVPQSAAVIDVLKTRSPADIAALMDLSDALATLNVGRYRAWSTRFTARNSKPAVLAFNGDVYEGLDARTLDDADLDWAQQHVVMLSGLYGALRPLDLMQPYRLEMGTRLPVGAAKDLYGYWGDTLVAYLNKRARGQEAPVIVNLASQEYFKATQAARGRPRLKARVIECVFEDWKGGDYKIISFFAKRARGLMLRYAISRRLTTPEALRDFAAEGYAHAPAVSSADRWVFRRRLPE
jgi:cytoplasmic iron level regulating protein YaaA (DUF328/UPF0246 family)